MHCFLSVQNSSIFISEFVWDLEILTSGNFNRVLSFIHSCLALPLRKSLNFSGDTQALENSGINPSHVVNSHIVMIHRFKRLYSKNSAKYVRIHNGKVDGSGDPQDPNVKIKLESVGSSGQVILKSYNGRYFICVDHLGTVIARPSSQARTDAGCVFHQDASPKGYTTFRSKLNETWYLGITRDGRTKSAKKTHNGQRAVQFLDINWQSSLLG